MSSTALTGPSVSPNGPGPPTWPFLRRVSLSRSFVSHRRRELVALCIESLPLFASRACIACGVHWRRLSLRPVLFFTLLAACMTTPPPAQPNTPPAAVPELTARIPGDDPHSFARPAEALVRHLRLDLSVDFEREVLTGTVMLTISRAPGVRELVLDTRDLEILAMDVARDADVEDPARWLPVAWTFGGVHPILGRPLTVHLPAGDADVVRIRYRTSPASTGLQWLAPAQTHDRAAPFLYSQSQSIHARSWVPVQDSPGIRITFSARITAPPGLRPVMAAEELAPETGPEGQVVHRFALMQPIPAYLLALAVGRLESASLGPRTRVWAEPGLLAAARHEFADLEPMLATAERSFGPYRWGTYEVLVLPPAFPFGGMENPRVTFVTPTILAGDRSLVSLIAHELAHSWSGNLVSNATWRDLWLNEGTTVYLERRIVEAVHGAPRAELEAYLARAHLEQELAHIAPADQLLHIDLTGRDPDDAVSDIAYEKGYLFLRRLEGTYGRPAFDAFLRKWFDGHAFTSRTTDEFRKYLQAELIGPVAPLPGQTVPDVAMWLTAPGLPQDAPRPDAGDLGSVTRLAEAAVTGALPTKQAVRAWTPWHWIHFLRGLPLLPVDPRAAKVLADLDAAFALTAATNNEVLAEWLALAAIHGHAAAEPRTREFLATVGRRKYLVPIYAALLRTPAGKQLARELYPLVRPGYHALTRATIDPLLAWPKDQATADAASVVTPAADP